MKSVFAILLIFLFFLFACNKEETVDYETVFLDSRLDSLKFKTGSYWIYVDSLLGSSDSVYITKVDSGFYWNPPSVHGWPGVKREFYKIYYAHSPSGDTDTDLLEGESIRRNTELEWEICGITYYSLIDNSVFTKIDSMTVNDVVFKDVVKREIRSVDHVPSCSDAGFSYDTDIYTALGFGIIKMTVFEPKLTTTWILKRWQIKN